jgi:hypothetical protein
LAFLLDGRLVSIYRAIDTSDVIARIKLCISAYSPRSTLVRIGDGAPVSRGKIVEGLKWIHIPIEIVDERRTTTLKKYRDEAAAVMIAQTKGEPI